MQQRKLRRVRDEWLASQPPCDELMRTTVYAWNLLGSERSIGFAVGPIPHSAVVAWCDRQPWADAELTTQIAEAINYLDGERQRKQAAQQQADKRQTQNPRSRTT